MNKNVLSLALLALAAAASPTAFAEDSQEETPQEERDYAATLEQMTTRMNCGIDQITAPTQLARIAS